MEELTLGHIHKDLLEIKVELKRISSMIEEDFELSDEAKKELAEARKESLSEYIDHEDVAKELE